VATPYADAVYRDAIQRLPPEAESLSVSLLAVQFGHVHQTGTGALVRVATDRFLVTAAHVITQAERAKCPLSIGSKFGNAVPLSGKVVYTTPTDFDGEDDDLADVAVYQLEPAVVAQLPDGCQFLGLESIALNDDLGSDLYVTLGMPTEWTPSVQISSERGLHGTALKYLMTWRPPEPPSPDFRNYDPNIHLLLNADPEKRYAPDGETVDELSGLKGLSGSAVWRCHIHERLPPKVVAVQTSTYRRSVVKATAWRVVLKAFVDCFPQHRPILNAHLNRGGLLVR